MTINNTNSIAKQAIAIICYSIFTQAEDKLVGSRLIYQAAEICNINITKSFVHMIEDRDGFKKIIKFLKQRYYEKGKKHIVIVNNFKLAEANSQQGFKLSDLIADGTIDLYQPESIMILRKITNLGSVRNAASDAN